MWKSINVIQHINKTKDHKRISSDAENVFDRVQHSFRIKTSQNMIEENYLNIINISHMSISQLTQYSLVRNWKVFLYDQEQGKDAHSYSIYYEKSQLEKLGNKKK